MKKGFVLLTLAVLVPATFAGAAKAPTAGTLDRSFSKDGMVSIREDEGLGWFTTVAGTPAGKVVGGLSPGRGVKAGRVVRYLEGGAIDRKFGRRGYVTLRFSGGSINPTDLIVDRSGRTIIAGRAAPEGRKGLWGGLARLKKNGKPDRSFGGDGLVTLPMTAGLTPQEIFFSRGGKVVLAGLSPKRGPLVIRFRSNGRPDRSFSGDGSQEIRVGGGETVDSVAVDPRGRVVVGLTLRKVSERGRQTRVFGVVRLRPGGGFDRSFSGDGLAEVDPTLDGYSDYLSDLTIDRRGRIVVVGETNSLHSSIIRLGPRGGLDLLFSELGRGDLSWMNALNVAVDSRGRILVSGYETPEGFEGEVHVQEPSGRLERFLSNGNYDRAFRNGYYFRGLGDMVFDDRGRILASASIDGETSGIIRVGNR